MSKADSCLFIRDDCICITYVDDILVFAQTKEKITLVMEELTNKGASLKKEDDVAGFLVVDITKSPHGWI